MTQEKASPTDFIQEVGSGQQFSTVADQPKENIQKKEINHQFEMDVHNLLQRLVDEKFAKEADLKTKQILNDKSQKKIEKQIREEAQKRLAELMQKEDFKKEFDAKIHLELQKRIQQINQQKVFDQEILRRQEESQNSYNQQQTALFSVVNRTREFPLVFNPPKDVNKLYRVEYPEEGGILSRMENFILPYRGFPYQETVQDLDKCKKIGKTFLLLMLEEIKAMSKLKALFIVLFLPSIARSWLKGFHVLLRDQRFKEEMYCQPVKELWRALNSYLGKAIVVKDLEFAEMRRDLICMALEYDNAYKYRWQALVVRFNKKNLKRNTLKELNRVIDIAINSELPRNEETQPKHHWKKMKMMINILFWIKPEYIVWLRDLILELNFDEIRMKPEDICFCEKRTDFDFQYKNSPEYKEWLKIKSDFKKKKV